MEIKIGPDALKDIKLIDDNGNSIPATEVDIKLRVGEYPEIRMVLQEKHILFCNNDGKPLVVEGINIAEYLGLVEIKGEVNHGR